MFAYVGNRQKSSVEKSPWNKKSLKKNPTILRLFSGSSMILYKNVPGYSPLIIENAWEQRIFKTWKKGQHSICKRIEVQFFFFKRLKHDLIYLRILFLEDFIS